MSSRIIVRPSACEERVPLPEPDQTPSEYSPLASGPSMQNSLVISPADIDFFNVAEHLVAIEIKVTNDADAPSAPDTLQLLAAPLGAFVPWQPLATIALPALAPREVRFVRWRAIAEHPQPLGSPDGIGPRDLLTALGLGDEPPDESGSKRSKTTSEPGARSSPPQPARTLPPGLMELLLQTTPHWVGNINVLVGQTDVERHRVQALRVDPGRLNMAWFIVGGPTNDAYALRLHGVGAEWTAKLFDMTSRETLVINADDGGAIVQEEWIETQGSRTMLLALRAPVKCEPAAVAVHVTQRSSGRKAVVEFSLDPKAAGRGCYTV